MEFGNHLELDCYVLGFVINTNPVFLEQLVLVDIIKIRKFYKIGVVRMLCSSSIRDLKPALVVLPNEVGVHLAKLAQKREMEIGDVYNTFHIIDWTDPWVFCTDYDNRGYWDEKSPDFKLPITVDWKLEKFDEGNIIFSPYAVGKDFDSRSREATIWIDRMTECLATVGFKQKVARPPSRIIAVPQQPWRDEVSPFYCLESELRSIAGEHVRELLRLLGLQLL